jgi:hypothetical protein
MAAFLVVAFFTAVVGTVANDNPIAKDDVTQGQ